VAVDAQNIEHVGGLDVGDRPAVETPLPLLPRHRQKSFLPQAWSLGSRKAPPRRVPDLSLLCPRVAPGDEIRRASAYHGKQVSPSDLLSIFLGETQPGLGPAPRRRRP
jgi:hypothetical protein